MSETIEPRTEPITETGRQLFSRLWATSDYGEVSKVIAGVAGDIAAIEAEAFAAGRAAARRLVELSDDLARWDEANGYVVNAERDVLAGEVAQAWSDVRQSLATDSRPDSIDAADARHRQGPQPGDPWRDPEDREQAERDAEFVHLALRIESHDCPMCDAARVRANRMVDAASEAIRAFAHPAFMAALWDDGPVVVVVDRTGGRRPSPGSGGRFMNSCPDCRESASGVCTMHNDSAALAPDERQAGLHTTAIHDACSPEDCEVEALVRRLVAEAVSASEALAVAQDEPRAGLRHAIAREFTYTGPHDYRTARAIVDSAFDSPPAAQVPAQEERLDVERLEGEG